MNEQNTPGSDAQPTGCPCCDILRALNAAVRTPSTETLLAVKRAHSAFDTKQPSEQVISASLECPSHRWRDSMDRFWTEYDRLMDVVNNAVKDAGLTRKLLRLYKRGLLTGSNTEENR